MSAWRRKTVVGSRWSVGGEKEEKRLLIVNGGRRSDKRKKFLVPRLLPGDVNSCGSGHLVVNSTVKTF